jgi:membrane protease YdiL (CAAX protease family)
MLLTGLLFALLLGCVAFGSQLVPEAGVTPQSGPAVWSAWLVRYAAGILAFGFGVPLLVLLAWRRWGERAPAMPMITGAPRIRWGLFTVSLCITTAVTGAGLAVAGAGGSDLVLERLVGLAWPVMAGAALALLAGFAVQAVFEELWVRGWLVQRLRGHGIGLAGALAISCVVFTVLHWRPHVPLEALAGVGLVGVFLALAAWRSGGLEASWGAHLANNWTVAVLGGALGGPVLVPDLAAALTGALAQGLCLLGLVELWGRFAGSRGGRPSPG